MKLLVVENDIANAAIIKRFLQGAYDVDVAYDSKSAVDLVDSRPYDGYLLDINLGEETNGIELMAIIKDSPNYTGQPIISVTAYATAQDRHEFLNSGFTHYIPKPVDKYKLIEVISGAIEDYKKEK